MNADGAPTPSAVLIKPMCTGRRSLIICRAGPMSDIPLPGEHCTCSTMASCFVCGCPSPGLFCPDPDADPAPQWAVPAPANDAALQLICFKYVAGAHDVRKLLSELHDVESGESDQEPVGWFAVDFVCRSAVGCAAQPVNPITADSAYVVSLLHSSRPHYCRRRPVQPVRRGQRSGRY